MIYAIIGAAACAVGLIVGFGMGFYLGVESFRAFTIANYTVRKKLK